MHTPGNARRRFHNRARRRYIRVMSTATAANKIVRALRAAHLRDAPRGELLRLACEKLRGLGAPFTSVYAYMLRGDELVLEAFAGRETEHTRIPVGRGVCGTAVATGEDQNIPDDRKSTRLNSSHITISYAVFCLKKKKKKKTKNSNHAHH